MKVVVMAGGAGSRLRPLTIQRPKPMVPIINKPVISHTLDLLKQHGASEVIITVQYMADFIQNFFGDGSNLNLKIHYSVEETPLGTAGSVKNAENLLDNTFIVISGDALTNFNLTKIVEFHKKKKAVATLALYRISDPMNYGVITLNNENQITRFQEKPSRGSVMSDYVNTGIYVLEPEVLKFFKPNVIFDFANDLFPLLQAKGYPIYGYVADGYWCDIGNISEYMRATGDALYGRVEGLDMGTYLGDGIWVGEDVEIASDAHLEGPIYLGNSVQIRSGAVIKGPAVIRDYGVVDSRAHIEHSIFWRNCYVGERVDINGAIVLRQCSIKARSTVFEGAIIGDGTIVGAGAILHSNVKIWPGKEIEPRATVNSSIIWGSQGRRDLFGEYGVSGMVNVDLTPEFSAKLGAAFGATLPKNAFVTINRDIHRSPRMIKRAIISGLPSAGINVWDLGSQAIPVARYYTNICGAAGGVHVRLSPNDQRVVDIHFMDSNGLSLNIGRQQAVERVFFREDFRRVYLDDTGSIEYAQQVKQSYISDFLKHLNTETIKKAKFKIVIDFANAPAANVLPSILDELNCNIVALNANIDDSAKNTYNKTVFQASLRQMQIISGALNSQLGVCLDPGGEKIFIVDDRGYLLEGVTACAAMVDLALRDTPGSTVAIPINLPNMFEAIAARHDGRVIRTDISPSALIKTAQSRDVIMAGNEKGNFIFPDFQYAYDGLMALAKMLEFLATQNVTLGEIVSNLPAYHTAQRKVTCAWEAKATVMRLINERFQYNKHQLNGVKVELDINKWVLIMPDPGQPYFRITTEADTREEAETLADEYVEIIENISPIE